MPISTINAASISGLGYGFKNRIINGDMRIDQRNAGASVSTASGSSTYTVDRWLVEYSQTSKLTVQQNAGAVTPPAGYTSYLGVTTTSAYSIVSGDFFALMQRIEGFNVADLAWGTANAAPITVSFWVRSSLTGAFGASIRNNAGTRAYPFTYAISAANTWEQKTVTIPGDTSGTWLTNNGIGLRLDVALGAGSTYSGAAGAWQSANLISTTGAVSVVGTNGATFYITGVQLEAGVKATNFDYRPYGLELALCQRYFIRAGAGGFAYAISSTNIGCQVTFPVEMRAAPTVSAINGSGFNLVLRIGGNNENVNTYLALAANSNRGCLMYGSGGGYTIGGYHVMANFANCDAEL